MGGKNKNKNHKSKGSSGNGGSKSKTAGADSAKNEPVTIDSISTEFKTIILDFLRDIDCSFPEYHETLTRYLGYSHEMKPMPDDLYIELYSYCKMVYPSRFFDILYKNDELFKTKSDQAAPAVVAEANTMFLPNVEFRDIWNTEDITENTKDIIWKYLQLILFSIVNNLSDMGSFGDTAKLFEAIDEGELKTKLEEVIGSMSTMFDNTDVSGNASGVNSGDQSNFDETFKKASAFMNTFMPEMNESGEGEAETSTGDGKSQSQNTPPVPDAGAIHEHLSSMLNGKIGKLAKEIAEETAADLDLNMDNETSMKGIFQQLLKNPSKLSGIIKSVGGKLDTKLKSGELKESEIMQEASELMNKMKSMPGMNNIASMLSKMGMNMPGGMGGMSGGGSKVNFGAMQAQLQKNMKQAQMRERLMKKVQDKQQSGAVSSAGSSASHSGGKAQTNSVFRSGERLEKTPRFQPSKAQESTVDDAASSVTAAAAAEARMLATEKQNTKHKQE